MTGSPAKPQIIIHFMTKKTTPENLLAWFHPSSVLIGFVLLKKKKGDQWCSGTVLVVVICKILTQIHRAISRQEGISNMVQQDQHWT